MLCCIWWDPQALRALRHLHAVLYSTNHSGAHHCHIYAGAEAEPVIAVCGLTAQLQLARGSQCKCVDDVQREMRWKKESCHRPAAKGHDWHSRAAIACHLRAARAPRQAPQRFAPASASELHGAVEKAADAGRLAEQLASARPRDGRDVRVAGKRRKLEAGGRADLVPSESVGGAPPAGRRGRRYDAKEMADAAGLALAAGARAGGARRERVASERKSNHRVRRDRAASLRHGGSGGAAAGQKRAFFGRGCSACGTQRPNIR